MSIAEQIRDELLAIKAASSDNMLHTAEVVDWARKHTKSQLHRQLEWDDSVAAEHWREQQVRLLIHIYVRTADDRPQLISLLPDRVNGGGYRDISDVGRAPRLSRLAEEEALRELLRILNKYGHIKRFLSIWKQVEKADAEMNGGEEEERRKA